MTHLPIEPIVLLGAVTAGFVQGVSGFALALVAMAFWTGVLAPQEAAPLIAIGSVIAQVLALHTIWPHLDLRRAAPMAVGGVLGVPLGVAVLPFVNAGMLQLGVGLLLCVWCPCMLLARRLPEIRAGGQWADGAAGTVGGVMGGIAGLAGPAPILWCNLRGWPHAEQRAVYQTYLIVAQAMAFAGYAAAGMLTPRVWHLALWTVPAMLVPSILGTFVYARLKPLVFRRIVLGLLLATGVVLVAESLI